MKGAVIIGCCVVIMLVFGGVEGQLLKCATINLRMLPCYLHVISCHPNCKEPPCNDQCAPPPIACCVQLGRIAKGITTDADAKLLCGCIQDTVVDRQGSPFTGVGISVLPKECMLAMKLPTISADTKCKKWKKRTILKGY